MNNLKQGLIIALLIIIALIYFTSITALDPAFFYEKQYSLQHKLVMKGPNGEVPESLATLVQLSKKIDTEQLRSKKVTVAISMHDLHNDWSQALLQGLQNTLDYYQIEVIAVTNGEFNSNKQINDIKQLIDLKPDILISLPLDALAMESVYKQAITNNIKLLFVDSIANGLQAKEDYISLVIGDSYQLGALSAESLAKLINYKGKVALLNWSNKMFTVDQRTLGAQNTFKKYENIEVVSELSFLEFYEINNLIKPLVKEHPDLAGLWTVWDTPAFEAIKALKEQNHSAIVATVDMNKAVAESIMDQQQLKATAVDHPHFAGIALGLLTALEIEQVSTPSYVVIHATKVSQDNLQKVWQDIYHKPYTAPLNGKAQ
ncbi:MAG: substrate-binding domain-containing protein [Alteromonadales bacterium]|nr:substrate-binding domain-containing protein [Alteromonadales bacterium]